MVTRKELLQSYKRWHRTKPSTHERTLQLKRCGKKCFIGSKKSFPICNKGTCIPSKGGLISAYVRAREMISLARNKTIKKHRESYYYNIAKKSKNLLGKLFYNKKTRKSKFR